MREHGASRPPTIEEKYPEQVAEYIVQTAEQPSKPATWRAEDSGLPINTAKALEKKLRFKYSEELEDIKPLAVDALERRITHRLNVLDRYLTDETLEAKLAEARLKDIGIYEAIFLDKLLTIKGQPTAIMRVEDSMKLDQLGAAILREIKNRGLEARLTERTAEVTLDPTCTGPVK